LAAVEVPFFFSDKKICDRIRRALNVRIEIALRGILQIAAGEITTINANETPFMISVATLLTRRDDARSTTENLRFKTRHARR
jgi:hypothetical protein